MITLADIEQARNRIAPYVKRTPLERSETLSRRLATNVYVKYELFQKTGSFKPRGGFNKMLALTDAERARGVVAVSGGNHAQAVAYAARALGTDAVILMPENTPANYVAATRGYGAAIDLQPTIADAFSKVEFYTRAGRTFVHPFDDPLVMAGQGTVGLEILEDCPQVTDVFVSIGGGGLMTGVATAIKEGSPPSKGAVAAGAPLLPKERWPEALRTAGVVGADGVVNGRQAAAATPRVFGVETLGADAMSQALAAGRPVSLPAITSIAKTLGAPAVSGSTFAAAQDLIESVTVVTDDEAVTALRFILERLKVITEPAASCTLAAADRLKSNFTPESHVVLIFCGGNFSIDDLP